MARQRMLHPHFFTDGGLCQLTPLHRLLFAGLWCEADREGRLEDRPVDLKIRLLPVDNCDVNAMLDDLAGAGLLCRYVVNGAKCIAIASFRKYQRPHPREPQSSLPAQPPETRAAVEIHGQAMPRLALGKPICAVSSESVAVSSVSSVAVSPPAVVQQPKPIPVPTSTTPGEEFWAWAQETRAADGHIREAMPPSRGLSTFMNEAMLELNGDDERLKEAWWKFGVDPHWEKATPPFPWSAFAKGWRKYVPKKAPEERGHKCARCGSPATANIGLDESPTWACYPCVGEFRVWSSQHDEPWLQAKRWASVPKLKAVAQ